MLGIESYPKDCPRLEWGENVGPLCLFGHERRFAIRLPAEHYLHEYREHQEADYDSDFDVVFVARIDHSDR